jgi:hypothetical protein
MSLGGRLVQWYEQGVPSRWLRSGTTEAGGSGEVPVEEVWALLAAAGLDRADPAAVAQVTGLRDIMLGGRTLEPGEASAWRKVLPMGPLVDRSSSTVVVAASAAVLLLFWGAACLVLLPLWRRRFPTAARRVPTQAAMVRDAKSTSR